MAEWNLSELGWKPFFQQHLALEELDVTYPARIAAQHRSQLLTWSEHGEQALPISLCASLDRCTVGDWLLIDRDSGRPLRVLERISLLQRRAAGSTAEVQLIAANVDILLIVSSCNQEFNLGRLERYLAIALDADIVPIVVLTKADLCEQPETYRDAAESLRPGLPVECVNALSAETMAGLLAWCDRGRTLALIGSSGVGKSTIAGALGVPGLATGGIREADAKGRHTTTARSLHRLSGGALLIDNPGMRELQLAECESGVTAAFTDLLQFANCRFADCEHRDEPGCGVTAAIAAGELDERRLHSYRKLLAEQRRSGETLAQQRSRTKSLGKYYKRVQNERRRLRDSGGG